MRFLRSTFFILLSCALLTGCAKQPKETPLSLLEAEKKFIETCRKEFNLDIKLFPFENTLWIYLPLKEPFIKIQSSPVGPTKIAHASEDFQINFLDGMYKNSTISIQYDITPSRQYANDPGYSTKLNEKFQRAQSNILTALSHSYPDEKEVVNEAGQVERMPQFIVLVLADIETGLELEITLSLEDYKRVLHDSSFAEEYQRRSIIGKPLGNTNIIGDTQGRHLNPRDLTWGEFLTKQILYRIEFKYQRSDFKPTGLPHEEIVAIAARTIGYYDFEEFDTVKLYNLIDATEYNYSRADLNKHFVPARPAAGKFPVGF